MLRRIKRAALRCLKWLVAGEQFKRYTRPSPAAEPGPRLRIGICYLVPLLGDAVMLFPLIDALREKQPDAEIVAFVAGMGSILRLHPGVDRVHERPRRGRLAQGLWPIGDIVSLWLWWRRELRGECFDVCVMLRCGSDPFYAAHLAWLLGARERVGYSAAVEPERARVDLYASPLLTGEIARVEGVHEVERGAEVLRLAGLLSGPVDTSRASPSLLAIAESRQAQEFLASIPELAQPYFVLSPGASVASKEWPEAKYAAVAQKVAERGWLPVIVGGPEVRGCGDRIAALLGVPSLNLAGRTDFVQLAAVCAGARCFLGNDSGTGHVAGALATPVVILSSYPQSSRAVHQTSPQRTHPAGPWYAMVQPEDPLPPCVEECLGSEAHCITQIEVATVLAALEDLLAVARPATEVMSVDSG